MEALCSTQCVTIRRAVHGTNGCVVKTHPFVEDGLLGFPYLLRLRKSASTFCFQLAAMGRLARKSQTASQTAS